MEDGSSKSGLIQIPKRPSSQKIKFKDSEKAARQVIKIQDIKCFLVKSELGDTYILESNYIDQSKKEGIKRVTKFRIFLLVEVKGYDFMKKKSNRSSLSLTTLALISFLWCHLELPRPRSGQGHLHGNLFFRLSSIAGELIRLSMYFLLFILLIYRSMERACERSLHSMKKTTFQSVATRVVTRHI